MLNTTVIVAGGNGSRMSDHSVPKQFIILNKLPILMHTISTFYNYDATMEIILVLPESHIDFWNTLCIEYSFTIKTIIVEGGVTRYQSVKKGLSKATGNYIAIHDGVRPLVSQEVIARIFKSVETFPAVVPVIPMNESLRRRDDLKESVAVDRSDYFIVQTPQVFESFSLKHAYDIVPNGDEYTDDASLVQSLNLPIKLIEGNRENIKITYPEDLRYAQSILFNLECSR